MRTASGAASVIVVAGNSHQPISPPATIAPIWPAADGEQSAADRDARAFAIGA